MNLTPSGQEVNLTPFSQEVNLTPFSQEVDLTPFSQEVNLTPFGQEAGLTPFGQEASLTPFGQEAGLTPFGQEVNLTPFGQEASRNGRAGYTVLLSAFLRQGAFCHICALRADTRTATKVAATVSVETDGKKSLGNVHLPRISDGNRCRCRRQTRSFAERPNE